MKLTAKIILTGNVEAITGLRIGGNKSSLEIGGVDLNIIKSGHGVPYIPGSSIKGKLRSLLAKVRGIDKGKNDTPENDDQKIKNLFGSSGEESTRLFVRDANLDEIHFNNAFPEEKKNLDFKFSEVKTENRIDRSSGTAKDPRQIERVPAGAVFNLEIMMDVYEKNEIEPNLKLINEALQLLNLDYLGGHGSRGSGKVRIVIESLTGKEFSDQGLTNLDCSSYQSIFSDLLADQTA